MAVIKGRRRAPFSVFIYGPQGAGKSTCAADFPDPLFVSAQGGSDELDVARWVYDEKTERTTPLSWDELLAALPKIKAENGFKTLVIDELQAMELMAAQALCTREKVTSLGKIGGGYGKGEVALLEEMRKLIKAVEDIHASGKNVVFCSHSKQGNVPRPETGESYKRYEPMLTSVNNADIVGMFVGWCSAVLFVRPEVEVAKTDKKTIGVSTGRRVMHTEGEAAWIAKCRYLGVDPVIELPRLRPMSEFFKQVADGQDVERMKTKVVALAQTAGGEFPDRVAKWLSTPAANDLLALHERAAWLKSQAA